MPIFTFECEACSAQVDRLFRSLEEAETTEVYCENENCGNYDGSPMMKLPSAPNFTVRGYSSKNGYAQ